jgi:hypothetical protein
VIWVYNHQHLFSSAFYLLSLSFLSAVPQEFPLPVHHTNQTHTAQAISTSNHVSLVQTQKVNIIMKTAIKLYTPAVLTMLMSIPVSQASATDVTAGSKLAVKTSVAEVIGVREIESGKLEQGIRKSKAALAKTSIVSLRKPLLDNLCVAHLAINDMVQANQYCQAAVNTGRASAISYNNRAVMHYVLGNFKASLEDLNAASSQGRFQYLVAANLKIVKQQNELGKDYGYVTEGDSSLIAIKDS